MTATTSDRRAEIWSPNLIVLLVTVFAVNFGQGLFRGAQTNFYIQTLGMGGREVLWLAGLREIPGLALIFVAALIMRIPLARRGVLALIVMGVGYGLYAAVGSFTGLVVVAIVGSLGFHVWMPIVNALGMSLVAREHAGRVMGTIARMRALSSIVGMGIIAVLAKLASDMSLSVYFVAGGALTLLAAALLAKIPANVGTASAAEPRILLKRRYWLYYVLVFFEGSRVQVFGTFSTLILVESYGLDVGAISLLLLASSAVNMLFATPLGTLLDRYGEGRVMPVSYVLLAMSFFGYATVHNVWALGLFLIAINLLVTLEMGLSTWVRRIAPEEELTPTLSAGVSINHITSVGVSLLAGSLLAVVGYEALCYGAAAIILSSVPFAIAMRVPVHPAPQPIPSAAE
ncbi:MAG: MFS transporter [Chloroflexota bacterium]